MGRFGYLSGKQKHTIPSQEIEASAAVIRKTAAAADGVDRVDEDGRPCRAGRRVEGFGGRAVEVGIHASLLLFCCAAQVLVVVITYL
jgi:hypothetical protein